MRVVLTMNLLIYVEESTMQLKNGQRYRPPRHRHRGRQTATMITIHLMVASGLLEKILGKATTAIMLNNGPRRTMIRISPRRPTGEGDVRPARR
jgi:hypothetical protein